MKKGSPLISMEKTKAVSQRCAHGLSSAKSADKEDFKRSADGTDIRRQDTRIIFSDSSLHLPTQIMEAPKKL
jgi:hypothetical protein